MRLPTRLGAAAAFLLLHASVALAAWEVNERGECVETWSATSLGRGPAAMLNAPLLPFRSAAGGVQLAREDRSPGMRRAVLMPPFLGLAGGGMGLVESLIWFGTGLADTVTGGYFALAPEEATQLSVAPVTPLFSEGRRSGADGAGRDRCGRAVKA